VKLKDVFLGVLIVALIASEIFLFSANQQKTAALGKLKSAQSDLQQARAELEQTKTSDAATIASVRADNQSLLQKNAQLLRDNKQLRADSDKLSEQLGTAREAVQLQQQHLEQLQTQPAMSADEQRDTCIANLRAIQTAKAAWALEDGKTAADTPTEQDLLVYLQGGTFPICPGGGTYTIGAVGVAPTCTISGHVLPQQ
jgi:hypothetical protein